MLSENEVGRSVALAVGAARRARELSVPYADDAADEPLGLSRALSEGPEVTGCSSDARGRVVGSAVGGDGADTTRFARMVRSRWRLDQSGHRCRLAADRRS